MSQSNTNVSKLAKWLGYTVVIGLLPIALRLLASCVIDGVAMVNAADFIAVGFVLHISIFNELEHMSGDQTWKTVSNVGSICAIVIYGGLMFLLLVAESGYKNIQVHSLTISSITLAVCSFILCFVIFYRLNARTKANAADRTTPNGEPA
ncbi:hypothetical protein RDG65_001328 [Vibrio fluvialis]|nr:hypothetical protein [Vibrio fluvialis]